MDDIFRQRGKSQMIELILLLCDHLEIDKDTVIRDQTDDVVIENWYSNLNEPLDTKRVKYAKAIERITGTPATIYHACSYCDLVAMSHSSETGILASFNVCNNTEYDKAQIEQMWKFIAHINVACFEALDVKPPKAPTREEIQNNIRTKKSHTQTNDEQPSMTKAFQHAFNALCDLIKQPRALDGTSDRAIKSLMTRWNTMCNTKEGGKSTSIGDRLTKQDSSVLSHITGLFPELEFENIVPSAEIWKLLAQLNGFSVVGEKIPEKMMGRIEDIANKLADDIVAGKSDLGSLNLNEIGKQVLSGCNDQEMSEFASNIDSLIPAISNFKNGL